MTREEVTQYISYDPETGVFVRIKSGQTGFRGPKIVGKSGSGGYITIGLLGKKVYAHRLAWLIQTGSWPDNQIDHINRDRRDNRFSNLRPATNWQNQQNKKPGKEVKGAVFIPYRNRWVSRIRIKNKTHHLGYFTTQEAATSAYWSAVKRLRGEEDAVWNRMAL